MTLKQLSLFISTWVLIGFAAAGILAVAVSHDFSISWLIWSFLAIAVCGANIFITI